MTAGSAGRRSALVRIAEEVCLQGHLLALSFLAAVRDRAVSEKQALTIGRRQLTGIAGLTAERLRAALGLGGDLDAVATVVALRPALLPLAYVDIEIDLTDRLVIGLGRTGDADADGAWPSLIDAEHLEPIDALVRGVDPRFRCTVLADTADRLTVEVVTDDEPTREADEVALTRFSTGAGFGFEDRGAPVTLSRSR